MSSNGETVPEGTNEVTSQLGEVGKGKGKAVEQPRAMEEDEESEEESAAEEVYSHSASYLPTLLTASYSNRSLKKTVRYTLSSLTPTVPVASVRVHETQFHIANCSFDLKESVLT
jgi:hypothetical protein